MARRKGTTQSGVTSRGPRILITSLPKSGTNLLVSVLRVIPGLRYQKLTLNRKLRLHPANWIWPDAQGCLAGVDQPVSVRLRAFRYVLHRLDYGCCTAGHLPYQVCVDELLKSMGIRVLFIIRDPRDVVVSQVHHVLNRRPHFLHRDYNRLRTDKERLLVAIRGVEKGDRVKGYGIAEKLDITRGWSDSESALTLRFEDLVGAQGGGSAQVQQEAIVRIGDHVGVETTESDALSIGRKAFGQGSTFRRGQIGAWRDAFDNEVKDVFKKQAGEHLIRMGYESSCDW